MSKAFLFARYLFSPEDSRDSISTAVKLEEFRRLPRHAGQIKTALWLLLAFALAALLSQLQ